MRRTYTRHDGEWITNQRHDGVDFEWHWYYDCTISRCTFRGCTFSHCVFHQSYVTNKSLFDSCRFLDCRFTGSHSSMGRATYRSCVFENCKLVDTSLDDVSLDECSFPGTLFENITFNGARTLAIKVRSVDLSQARFHLVGFVNGVDVSQMKLPSTGLRVIANPRDRFAKELLEAACVPPHVKTRESQWTEARHPVFVSLADDARGQDPAVYDEAWLEKMLDDPEEAATFALIAGRYEPR